MKIISKYKTQLGLLLLVALVILAYVKRTSIKKFLGLGTTAPPPTSNNTAPIINTTLDKNKVLKYGDTGTSVKELQKLLNAHHKANLPSLTMYLEEDGVFGAKTEAMLVKYTAVKSISINQLITKLTA